MEFDHIIVKINFLDANNRKQEISADCDIEIAGNTLYIKSRKMKKALERGNYLEKYKVDNIPSFTEEEIYQILDFAKKNRIKWPYVINITLDLLKSSLKGYKWGMKRSFVVKHLLFYVNSDHDQILVELTRIKRSATSFNEGMKQIANYIQQLSGITDEEIPTSISGGIICCIILSISIICFMIYALTD